MSNWFLFKVRLVIPAALCWFAATALPCYGEEPNIDHAATGSSPPNSCETIFDRIIHPYINLYYKLPQSTKLDMNLDVNKMLTIRKDACLNSTHQSQIMKIVHAALAEHANQIGVLLPLSGPRGNEGQAILQGIKSIFPYRGVSFAERVIVRDTRGILPGLEQGLAELVFKHRVSVVIGGFTSANAQALDQYANQLRIPALIVNAAKSSEPKPYSFYVFPNEAHLVDALASHAKARGFRRIAMLQASSNRSRRFNTLLDQALKERSIEIVYNESYNGDDYHSMLGASETIFGIDRVARESEWQELIRTAKQKAVRTGVAFNPSMVALPPLINIDAVYIDDHFRSVRHLVKIFKFLGVEKIPLLGTPQWRSQGLIEPYDAYLDGAVFADYVGSYRELPSGIVAPITNSRYFVEPQVSTLMDYQIVGNQAARLADRVLSAPSEKRRLLFKKLEMLDNEPGSYFGAGRAFNPDHSSHWPAFLFQVGPGDLQQINGAPSSRQAGAMGHGPVVQ